MSNETQELLDKYRRIWNDAKSKEKYFKTPNTQKPIPPTIPFVGKEYNKSSLKTLIYGSAENLTYLNDGKQHDICDWVNDDDLQSVMNRHRVMYQRYNTPERFFKYIHMKPAEDGSLLIVARKILEQLKVTEIPDHPELFLESVSIANFGKYSIQSTNKNIDGANNTDYLMDSLAFIKTDIQVLKPDLIILPETIFRRAKKELVSAAIEANPNVKFAKIRQTNMRVINCHLKKLVTGEYVMNDWEKSWVPQCKGLNMKVFLEWIEKYWGSIIAV